MKPNCFKTGIWAALAGASMLAAPLWAQPSHGIAMYGDPILPADYTALPHANADAPQGGKITLGNTGGFTSLNPMADKGTPPWQLRFLTTESLMGRSRGEPFSLYGLLAESIQTAPDRSWVEFTLRPEARFSDGSPVTVDDVIWSYETLGTKGHGRYRKLWEKIESIQETGERSLRITFNVEDRELALIAGMRPIMKKSQWDGKDFAEADLNDIPITSAPYIVADYDVNHHVTLKKNPDYWGKDLAFRKGTFNFDEIRIDFYGDEAAQFEAFKAGDVDAMREFNAEKWATAYNFPRAQSGDVIKSEIPHQKPSGMTGLVFNTRRAPLNDWRVREALTQAFNFTFINDALTGGRQERIRSYFSSSILGMEPGAAEGKVAELLTPYKAHLLPGALEGYEFPMGSAKSRDRKGLSRAIDLMEEAGWTIQNGRLVDANGTQLQIEMLLRTGNQQYQSIMDIYAKSLDQLGISVTVTAVDNVEYKARQRSFDFDITDYRRSLSLSPGNEQWAYFGSQYADTEGSRNLMGVKSPAVDAMITSLLTSQSQEDFRASAKALDRALTSGRYVIPIWQFSIGRIAHDKSVAFPDTLPIYGDGADWMPQFWWRKEEK